MFLDVVKYFTVVFVVYELVVVGKNNPLVELLVGHVLLATLAVACQ